MSENKCRLFKRCGGCQLSGEYSQQLEWKQDKVNRLLSKFTKCEDIVGMKKPYNYRNKVQHAFYTNPKRQIISGIYQSGSGKIVACESCMLEDTRAGKIISTIRILMRSFKIFPFNPNTGKGTVRHVMVRKAVSNGDYLVCIITNGSIFPQKNNFVAALLKSHPYIKTVVQNICDNPMPLTMGERENVLYGDGYIEDSLCGKDFRISARSFYQVNPVQTEVLYKTAMEFASLDKNDRVLDCYSGTGTIGIIASDYCKEVIGAEINPIAVRDAHKNAAMNNCGNVTFIQADSSDFMEATAMSEEKFDVVFTDPPRTGCDRRFLKSLGRLAPEKVVYISCGIESLERDLTQLVKLGYKVEKIQPVDMFPHTRHVETVALLSRQKVTEHIYIDVNIADLPKTTRTTATYPEIKAYIKDKYGLCVSSLNIAQVKEKQGFEKRENYNKGKEGHRAPKCPSEKEKAIEDAFKHFGML